MHAPVKGLHAHYLQYCTQKINLNGCALTSFIWILSMQPLVCMLFLCVTTNSLDYKHNEYSSKTTWPRRKQLSCQPNSGPHSALSNSARELYPLQLCPTHGCIRAGINNSIKNCKMSFRYTSERSFQKISNWMINRYSFREAFVIRHSENLQVVTLQLVYKWGNFAGKIGIKNCGLPCYRISSTSY